ncbi:MAG: PaaI family thioesterase [Chitinivibrionales bacterium]|nr:PaaI family thioesterase [Chitinivibrionales bacterium]
MQNISKVRVALPKADGFNCFGCSQTNPRGLHLSFYCQPPEPVIRADITLAADHVGWENMAHGGIIATLLDETMGWAIIYLKKSFFVTRRMEIKYSKPTPVQQPLTVTASLLQEKRKGFVLAGGELLNEKNELLAKATADFVLLSENQLTAVPIQQIQAFHSIFSKLPLFEDSKIPSYK